MADPEDERAVLEVVELSESDDEDFDYKAVEVRYCYTIASKSLCMEVAHLAHGGETESLARGDGFRIRHGAQICSTVTTPRQKHDIQ